MSALKIRLYQAPGGEMTTPQPNDLFIVERATDHVAQYIKYSTLLALLGGGGGGGGGAVASVNGQTGAVVLNTDLIAEPGGATNKWYTDARVRACVLTGLSTGTGGAVVAGDTLLAAIGKHENRMVVNDAKVSYADASVRAVALTGLSTASGGAVVAADSLLVALGKLENRMALNDSKVSLTDVGVRAATLTGLNTALTGSVAGTDTVLVAFGKLEHRMAINDGKDLATTLLRNANNAIGTSGFQVTDLEVGSGPERYWHFDAGGGCDDGQASGYSSGTSNGTYDGAANPSLISRIGIAETLTNKTLTSPTIAGGALSGSFSGNITLAGDITFTGTPTFSNALSLVLTDPSLTNAVINNAVISGTWLGSITVVESGINKKFAFIGHFGDEYNFGYFDGAGEYIFDNNLIMRKGDLPAEIDGRINGSWKGAASGLCPLDSGSKVPVSYLPDIIVGQLEYQSVWNANTNSPTIPAAGSGNKGWYYVVSVAGSTTISGVSEWKVGDWLVSNGTTWDKVDNTDAVASVNGLLGAVTLNTDNIAESGSPTNKWFTTARVLATALTGLATGGGGTIAASDTILQAMGKVENRLALNDAKTGFTSALVCSSPLTGLSTASGGTVVATDTVLQAIGKLENRVALDDAKTGYTDALVRACTLAGLSTATGSAVTAADSILVAIGRLENRTALNDAKVTYADASVRACALTGLSTATGGAVVATDSIVVAIGRLENRVAVNDAKVGYTDALVRACVLTGLSTSTTPATVVAGDTTLAAIGKLQGNTDFLNSANSNFRIKFKGGRYVPQLWDTGSSLFYDLVIQTIEGNRVLNIADTGEA